jgi:ABC-type multidrug transport system fused ATPase/permease subunit
LHSLLEPKNPWRPLQSVAKSFGPDSFKGAITFRDVSFAYPSRPLHTVLKGFNLDIPVGATVALCGGSGSGKSTVGQLTERFYDVNEGAILVDGIDIRDLDPSWLRNRIGYINQVHFVKLTYQGTLLTFLTLEEPTLFAGMARI